MLNIWLRCTFNLTTKHNVQWIRGKQYQWNKECGWIPQLEITREKGGIKENCHKMVSPRQRAHDAERVCTSWGNLAFDAYVVLIFTLTMRVSWQLLMSRGGDGGDTQIMVCQSLDPGSALVGVWIRKEMGRVIKESDAANNEVTRIINKEH